MNRERPYAPGPEGRIPEAWIGREVMIETTEALSSDLRASTPVYLEDANDRGVVMLVTRRRDHNQSSRYFYPWGVVDWIRLAEDDEEEEQRPLRARRLRRLGRFRRAALPSAGHRAPYRVRRGVLPRPRLAAGRGGSQGADGLRGLRGHRAALPGRSRSGAARGRIPGLPAALHRSARARGRCGRHKGAVRHPIRPTRRRKTASLASGSVGPDARVLGIGTPHRQVDLRNGRTHENPLLARPRQIRPRNARAEVSATAARGFSGRTGLGR
jgi:hypothetical protein